MPLGHAPGPSTRGTTMPRQAGLGDDAALIGAAQKVEHYEIAGYGTARTYAELLGKKQWARLLQETLDEEKETDQKLNQLAGKINLEAKAA